MAENELAVIAKESNLSANKVEQLLSNFGESLKAAKTIAAGAGDIIVTDETQTKLMGDARAKRLELKNIRVEVEKIRKSLKEESLREGKAIDGMANIIKALIVPVEEHLEKQEKFAERAEEERKHKRHIDRIEQLSPFVENISVYNLMEMSEDDFKVLLRQAKAAFEAKQEAEKQAEIERQEAAEAEAKRQKERDAENERLKKEAAEKEAELAKERAAAKKLQDKKDEELRIEREKIAEIERKQAEDKAAADKKKAEEEEAQRQALLAPDKEKLLKFAVEIENIKLPHVSDREAGKVLDETADYLARITKNLRKKASEL